MPPFSRYRPGGFPGLGAHLFEVGLRKGAELAAGLFGPAPQLHLHRLRVPQLFVNRAVGAAVVAHLQPAGAERAAAMTSSYGRL